MKHEFFSGLAEILSRTVSLVLVILFYTIFFIGRGNIRMDSLVAQGTLILGSVVLYELMSFVFYELFSLVESKALSYFQKAAVNTQEADNQDEVEVTSENLNDKI